MRIAVAGFMHESNTFNPLLTDRDAFVAQSLTAGADLLDEWRDAHHEAGGFIEAAAVEGFELAPSYPARLRAALAGSEIRACFLGHRSFSAEDLAAYRGPKPQSEGDLSPGELRESASWIRHRSRELAEQCTALRVPYVDVGQVGFSAAMAEARRLLLGPS